MLQYRCSRFGVLMLTLSLSALLSPARAEEKKTKIDPTGTYTWERTRGDQTFKSTLMLKLVGDKVLGTYKGRRDEVPIENGKLEGDTLTFQITRSFNDREFTIKYRGKMTATGIKGTRETGRGEREWEAKRIVGIADALGLWKFKFEGRNGAIREVSLKIVKDGDQLKGLYTGRQRELEIKNIALKGDVLSFHFSRETDNGEFHVAYEGKLSGNSIKGQLKYRFGENERTREFVGHREVKRGIEIADVLGTWKLESTRDNGETSESSIKLTKEGDKLKGLYTSRYGEREVEKVKLEGNVLSFQFSGDINGEEFVVVYKGKLTGDSFKGTSVFERGDQRREREVTGRREKK